jgi:uncharacterized protein (TIGR02145 family)
MEEKISIITLILIVFTLFATGCKKDKKPADLLTDIEGNSYKTVTIGSQVWMAENLQTTKLVDGTDIPLTEDASAWGNLTTPGYCWYNNDLTFKEPFGALYNGFSVATGKLCPTGWHVPEMEEWQKLRDYLGDSIQAGGKLKETGTAHWLSPNKGADNSSGFTALGAGLRYFEGTFASINSYSSFWSSTVDSNDDEWFSGLYFGDTSFVIDNRNKNHGFSVRCLKD